MLAGVVVDAFAKAGMKSGMDGVDPVVEYEDTEDIDVVGIDATKRSNHAQRHEHPLGNGVIRGMNAGILSEAPAAVSAPCPSWLKQTRGSPTLRSGGPH